MIKQNSEDICHLLDKHLKSTDNYLPLKAFLQYIESNDNDLDGFRAISSVKFANLPPVQVDPNKSLNLTSTLKILQKNPETDDIILSQVLHKIIITVDYSPQSSSLNFIQKSLEIIFNKISNEFDEFYNNCFNTEPQIYVTVLLWNVSQNPTNQSEIPFITILHSKRLLKSNLNEIGAFIFDKINEAKRVILDSLKLAKSELRINTGSEDDIYHTHKSKNKSSFEEFIRQSIKLFNFFDIAQSAATSLACAHHIHLTEGIIYANDMIRCLEKISKSSITFSFIYTGTSSHLPQSNISSSFGHLANCSLMKQIAKMTNGFCIYLNESLQSTDIVSKNFFYHFKLKNLDLDFPEMNKIKNINKKDDSNDLRSIWGIDTEMRKIHKFEIDKDLMQLIRIRLQEGYFLSSIMRKNETNGRLISLYLKKCFTQTVSLVCKITYTVDVSGLKTCNYNVELWMLCDALHSKVKYHYIELRRRLKQFLHQMETSLKNYHFGVNNAMLDPPEILSKYKEPLYKLSNETIGENNQIQKSTFSLQNLNFELNNRTIKNNEIDYYNQFASSWNYLSFFKLHTKALNRYFAISPIKIVLYHDRPLPDMNTCIFDTKTRISLEPQNPNFIPNNVFQCTKAVNELRSVMTTWCDIMLVENCVFLKYLESSPADLKPNKTENNSKIGTIKEDLKGDKLQDTNDSNSLKEIKTFNSFVICIINEQYAPYVSLQFLFHSNIDYLGRVRLLENFKEKLNEFNIKKYGENEVQDYSAQHFILQKPELYDAFKFILFDEIQSSGDPKLNQSSKLVNFMKREKFKWVLNRNFSAQTAQNLKETLIDTFIRLRLKEGFKCLFQCSKFIALTLQLKMFDSAESQNRIFTNGSSQTCVFMYVIRFLNSKKSTLLNIAGQNEPILDDIDNEIYFTTELYVEAIDGIFQDRAKKKERVDYFKNLSNIEILNMIYLQDLKCFLILQSSYALFLSKNNQIQNLKSLIGKFDNLNFTEIVQNLTLKDQLMDILNFDSKYYECIRLLPDLAIVLQKHSIKESKSKARSSNQTSQYLFNRVNFNNRPPNKRELVNQNSSNTNAETDGANVKKKNLSLYEQLRPILNSIEISKFTLNQVEFDFNLKGVLFESSLHVCVYDDIPFNLFNLQQKNNSDGFRKIQNYFFQNFDETFRKLDEHNDQSFQNVINSMIPDIKNALILKINDIKTGDSITKKILEHLKQLNDTEFFRSYIKFNITQVTSNHSATSPSSININSNKSDYHKSNPWTSQTLIPQQYDGENNKIFVYGLFFIPSETGSNESVPIQQDPNRLVFFIFNIVPEYIKSSLIQSHSNTYLTRKLLYPKNNESWNSNTSNNSFEYKFYSSKNSISKGSSNQDLKSQPIAKNLKKLSDILKQKLNLNVQNDSTFLTLIDSIEENCSKNYIQSVVHYIANDMVKNYSLEKSAVQHLLSLGQKIPLNDIDLTDYFKMFCIHMTKFDCLDPCSIEQNSYLGLKFDEIFFKRFQSIPGFDDLFIFQVDNQKEIEILPQVDYLKYDDEISLQEEDSDDTESDTGSIEENFYESDSSEIIKKKRRKTLKSSSPCSNAGKHLSSNETSFVSKEHIIGFEIVTQISCEDADSRTRTTTLTPENNEPENSINNPAVQTQNKKKFFSKFTKFNFDCILNLAEISDCLKAMVLRIDDQNDDEKNSIKIFLRLNWYSFNDSNYNNFFNQNVVQAQNIASSNLSTHSSTTTVFNTGLNPQYLSQRLQNKFDYFHLLEPSLREFKWHLKDELLNNEKKIKNAKVFQYYINHIKHGFDCGYLNCAKLNKKIILNKITNVSNKNPCENAKPNKLTPSLLHEKNSKLLSTPQIENEDKSIINVDPNKFYSELSSLLKMMKYNDCNVQSIAGNFYFLDCLNESTRIKFKIFLSTKRETLKTSSSNAKSSPSQSQDGASSPTSRLPLQKQSMNDLKKINTTKNLKTNQETIINQLKLRSWFDFNHSDLDAIENPRKMVADLVKDFDCELEKLIKLCYLKLTLKDIDETRKWNNSLILYDISDDKHPSEFNDTSLTCPSVWSVYFKLHRLHQTQHKDLETNNFISQGLSKLRECLQNFKLDESAFDDLYVYTHNKDIYLLKLDEVYDEDERRGSILSRRPSYASINDSDQTLVSSRNTSTHGFKEAVGFRSQSLSGGNPNNQNQTPINQSQSKSYPPEFIKLSVFGLDEPDDELKKDLCKTLQSELDYLILNKMCSSIEKNNYKATSQQHLEKITDEDLVFFKQISDNTFDYEINLPFVFNFNRTFRDNFFFFLKQVFSSNFKAIDVSQASKSFSTETSEHKNLTSQLSFSYIPETKNFTKKTSDPLHSDMILVSRIFFQNSKPKRFGKQNVSLILVEAFYSVKGLDLVSNKVTRSNSMGASTIKLPQDSMERKNSQIGPTFVCRFYCRGENTEIANYKLSLKSALNEALIYFLTDYVTKIDPCEFVKKINLKKRPAKFLIHEDLNISKIHRKRHKSTGATELNSNKQFLRMNKTARDSKLGRLLNGQKIIDSNQLNTLVHNNFSSNLFDHKDYEDTLQYFKEPSKIFNSVYSNFDSDDSETSDSEDEEIALYKVQRSISMEPDLNRISLDKLTNEKTCLKLIYDWLKAVNLTNKMPSSNPQQGSFVLRKQFSYRTKYNLVNLIKDLESSVRELCKCELNVNYFTFRKESGSRESSRHNDSVFMEDDDLDMDDFAGLKTTKLGSLSQNLSKGENLLVTLNAEYGGMNSGYSSMSSSMNSSTLANYARVPSFNGNTSSSTLIQSNSSSAHTLANLMIKSISSTSGDLDSSLSLSNSLTMSSLSIKRIFCYCIVNSKLKNFTFYCFTTESTTYDSLKQWLDQTSDLITQRFHLVNNIVLYKFGGLIGDNIIYDLKKVKQLAVSASCNLSEMSSSSQIDLPNQESKVQNQKQQVSTTKFSKSPTIHRSISYNKPSPSPINPVLIANLQFNSNTQSTLNTLSSNSTNIQTHTQPTFSIKQLVMSQFNLKSYDSIVNLVNQQVNFCIQYLTPQPSISSDYSSVVSPNNIKTANQSSKLNSLYGVGLCYQLLEMQQIYRHPRKIYELAIGLGSQQNISPNSQNNLKSSNPIKPVSSSTSLVSPVNQTGPKFNLTEFYKNYIQPVIIPFHYCCTTLLFYSNWNELIITEKMLKKNSNYKFIKSNTSNSGNEAWYLKMRQIVLIEYSKFFESKGFIRLKDDRQIQDNKNNKNQFNENQIIHFIKWIHQDGFIYLTINLEEIYLNVKIGYCSRYRSANRQGFINDMMKFLSQDFHVDSFIYDYHLSAINSNFLSTYQSGMLISQTSYIISKFLDEFVDFFVRVPPYSSDKVFKIVHEKSDNSLKPNQFTLIFDFISYANEKLHSDKLPIRTLHTFGNNLTIYSLSDSENCSKYLIVKIEQFYKEVLRDKIKKENFIRITCFYLFINKMNQVNLSLVNKNLISSLNNDIEIVQRVIEESISMYRQEIFWDNLALSMQTIKNMLNETSNSNEPLIGLEISNHELEQILAISQQINILDLDSNLVDFMSHCYDFKDKIKNYLKFQLGQHFIYTESDSIEYCLLIINEALIKNFRFETEETKSTTIGDSEYLNSFVLIKFDKTNRKADLFQVNRVKIVESEIRQDVNSSLNLASGREFGGSKDVNQVVNSLLKSKSFRNLAFTINILMYILWENLFMSSEVNV